MQHARDSTSNAQVCQSAIAIEGVPEHTGSCKKAAAANAEGGVRPSDEETNALARDSLLGKLQRTFSSSLSRISSIVPAPAASRRRNSPVGANANAPVAIAGKDGPDAEATSPALDALLPFVPLMFRRDLLLPKPSFSTIQEPCMHTHQGAVMIADIIGFTALTEDLGRQGAAGVELLTCCMNNFFTLVIELVYSHGGDVMRFAGDSAICAFLATAEEAEYKDKGLAAATQRAVRCAAVLANDLGSMRMLMDGRLVALSEEERRLMRAAAATSKHDSEQLLRPSLGRATADSEPCTLMRGFPSLSAWSGSEKGASLGTPAHDDPPTQRSRSRSATQADIAAKRNTEPEAEPSMQARVAMVNISSLQTPTGVHRSSAVPGPKANRAAASGRRLGDLFAGISLIHSTDEADIPDRVERARGEPRPVIHPRRVTSNLAETAGGVPEQRPEQGTGQGLGRASSSKLRRRLLSEGSAISRSYTHFGAPRRATAPHGIGTWSSYMTLSELVRNSLTAKPDQSRIYHSPLTNGATASAESLPPAPPDEAALSIGMGKQAAFLSSKAQAHKASGDLVTLDAFFNVHSIAAHRPPHIPALRMLPDVAAPESAELPAFAMLMPQLPAAKSVQDRAPSGQTGAAGQASMKAVALEAGVGRDLHPQLRVSFKDAPLASSVSVLGPLPNANKDAAPAVEPHATHGDSGSAVRDGEPEAAPSDACDQSSSGASGRGNIHRPGLRAEQQVYASDRMTQPLAGSKGGSRTLRHGGSRKLPSLALFRDSDQKHHARAMADGSTAASAMLMELQRDQSYSSAAPAEVEMSEAVGSSMAAASLGSAEVGPMESEETGRGLGLWRSTHGSLREDGSLFKKRRWSLLSMGRGEEDRRLSVPTRRVQQRLTKDIALRDRRWPSIFGKAVLPQRQDPFSVVSRLEAASTSSHGSQLRKTGSFNLVQQLRHTNILSLKVAVGCGSICVFHVGGMPDSETSRSRWEFFIGDRPHCASVVTNHRATERQPMEQISAIEHFLDPGEVAVSSEAAEQVQGLWELQPLPCCGYRLLFPQGPLEKAVTDPSYNPEQLQHNGISQAIVDRAEKVLRAHLPDAVSERIETGHVAFISELRVCTILFIGFPSLKEARPVGNGSSEVTSIQAAIIAVQQCMQLHSGSFLQFRCDEKGFVSICAFGLPGNAHEDDPCRGVRAALELVETLHDGAVVGVTTGELLCACVGSIIRSEYTVYGNAINLSARLMSKAAAGGCRVLCDSTTYHLAPKVAAFNCLKLVEVKGRRKPVTVYEALTPCAAEPPSNRRPSRASWASVEGSASPNNAPQPSPSLQGTCSDLPSPLIGADLMMTQVIERVVTLAGASKGGCILVEGEAGMGKSRLLEEIQHTDFDGRGDEVTVLRVTASTAHRNQAVYPWRRIFRALFAHDRSQGQEHTAPESGVSGVPNEVTRLGTRLHECSCEWREWRKSLSALLEVLEDEMPGLPLEHMGDNVLGDEFAKGRQVSTEGQGIRLGWPSKSMPTAMLPETAKTITMAAPSMGSPFAAYAAAMPEDSAFSCQPKTLCDARLNQTLSEGRAAGLHGRISTPLGISATEVLCDCAAGASTFPLSPFRPGFGKVTRELIAQTPEYASVSHDQSTQQLPSNPNTMANKTQQELNFTLRSRHARSASPQQQIGNRWLIPHQAMARAQAAMGILTPHNSLASLASSMRSEEQAGLSLDKQLPGRTISDHEGFDPQPVSLCRQSEDIQWKSIGRQTEEVRRKSVGSPVSPASSVDNSLRSDAGSMHSLSHLAQFPGSRAGMGSPGHPTDLQWSGLEFLRHPLDSQTDEAETGSTSSTSIRQLNSHVTPRAGSAGFHSVPLHASNAALVGRHAAATPMASPLSTTFSRQLGSSGSDSTSQDKHGRVQGGRATCQQPDLSARPPNGQQRGQPLIPYRSGDVELTVHEHSMCSIGSQPAPVPKQLKTQAVKTAGFINRGGSDEARRSGRTSVRMDRATSANNPASRRNQAMNMFLASAKPSNSALHAPRALTMAPALNSSSRDTSCHSIVQSESGVGPQGYGAADLDVVCDAAIASLQAARPEPISASLPGTSLVKAAKQSSTGALVRGERSPSLDNTSRANVAKGALGTKGRPQSTSARLASAESMLPRAALLNLRQHAIARAASKARQEKTNDSMALTEHAAASVPVPGPFTTHWDPSQLQKLRTKSTSTPIAKGRGKPRQVLDATQAGKPCMLPEAKSKKLQELLLTVLREWTRMYGPLLLLMDDFDRADPLSWSLLARVAEQPDLAVLVVAAIRPSDGVFAAPPTGQAAKLAARAKVTALREAIRANPSMLRLLMQPFTPEQTHTFLSAALDGVHVSDEVAHNVWKKTGGLPLYMEQMMLYMQQQQRGKDEVDAQDGLSAFIHSTVTVRSLITGRIDKLRPSEQLTLKIASVMGESVSLHLLQAMYPMAVTAEAVERDLLELEKASFLRRTDVPGTWLMTQALARDVAYELIPFSQRRSLHAKLAAALGSSASADLVPPSTVAYHWTQSCAGAEAGHWHRALYAVEWWEKAAQAAVEEGIDPAEAVRLFQRSEKIAGILKAAFRLAAELTPLGQSETSKPSFWAARRSTASALSARSARSSSSGHAHTSLNWMSRVVHPVRRAHWQRCMASLQLVQGDLDSARRHGLRALHFLGAPLPSGEPELAHSFAWAFSLERLSCVVAPCLGSKGWRVSDDGSFTSEGSTALDMATWIADSLQWPGQEADGEQQPASEVDWERKKVQVAAAVLELLVSASLLLQPIDADALKYVRKTARLLQGLKWGRRFPRKSLLFPVVQKCRAALAKQGSARKQIV